MTSDANVNDMKTPGPPKAPGAPRWLHGWRLPPRKRWVWLAGTLGLLIAVIYVVAFLIDEPLRQYMEREVNSRLTGYTVRIRALRFHPLGFSIDLKDFTIFQDAHPDPPVAQIPKLSASVDWRALLHGRVVADLRFDQPKVSVNLMHFKTEAADKVPLAARGWQQALEALYFDLKINQLKVVDGELTYVDQDQVRPLRVSNLDFRAENIRNIRSKDHVYPSDIQLTGVVFGVGRLQVDGHADFLAEPHAGVLADFKLDEVTLGHFKPITDRYNLSVRKGVLSLLGQFEYAPRFKTVTLRKATVSGVEIDYIHTPRTAAAEAAVANETVRTAKEVSNHPEIRLRIDEFEIVKSRFGYVDKAGKPEYRLFLTDTKLSANDLSNQRSEGTAVATLKGKFMGTGDTLVNATFRPETGGADLDLKVRIENTDMVGMNELLRARGNFDVVAGQLSLYSEIRVRNGAIDGYVKPLFSNLDVYDAGQDREKGFLRRTYERLIGAGSVLLRNTPHREVATKATISGSVANPQASRWEIVRRFIQNAFFEAILPGLETERRQESQKETDHSEIGQSNGGAAATGTDGASPLR